ncbi:MAG: hypothetical protein N3G21_02295 [Candidatus Hydrogenedentes bacterium]|nr:hypothetical protein [Candidatus Hydrogenedentota bacterium]
MTFKISRRSFICGISGASLIPTSLIAQNNDNFPTEIPESEETLEDLELKITPYKTDRDMPIGKIGNVEISRLIAGGNIISGIAHSRDLIYVSKLMRNYFTTQKIIETLKLYEANGINTAIMRVDDRTIDILTRYWRDYKGKIQWIAQAKPKRSNLYEDIDIAIDNNAVGAYIQGQVCDEFVKQKDTKLLGRLVEYIRKKGVISGIGAHSIEVIISCEKEKIYPDFYMKTFHPLTYWSAKHPEYYDNKWDFDPEKTKEVMKNIRIPWIAFKVLAGGALHPKKGFDYAFKHGADFICAGIFDFQVEEDAKIAIHTALKNKERDRTWYG